MTESSRVSEAHAASGAGVHDRDVMSNRPPAVEGRRQVDAIAVLQVLANHKKRILKITLAAACWPLIVAMLLPKMYTATTTVLPPQQNQSTATAMLGQLGAIAGLGSADLGLKNPDDLFVAMLQSRTIEDRLIDRFDLRQVYSVKQYQEARKTLPSRSDIVAEKEGLISISVTDRDPKRAADLANAYVDELHELNGNLAITEAGQRRVFYQQTARQRTRSPGPGGSGLEAGGGKERTGAARRPGEGDRYGGGRYARAGGHSRGATAGHAFLRHRK